MPQRALFFDTEIKFCPKIHRKRPPYNVQSTLVLTRADFIRLFPVYPSGGAEGFPPRHTSVKASLQRPVLCDPTVLLSPGLVDFIVPQGKLFSFRQQLIS